MKNLRLGISGLALLVASSAFAQTTSNKWLIGVGAHGVNHVPAHGGINKFFDRVQSKSLYSMNNYAITPPLSKLTVARNLTKGLVLDWQTSVANIANNRFTNAGLDKEFFLSTGLGLQYKFNSLFNEDFWFDPYIRVGAGYLRHDYSQAKFPTTDVNGVEYGSYAGADNAVNTSKVNHFTTSGGLGTNIWLTKNFGLGIQGEYVLTPLDKSDVANFWQASASLLFRFGNSDKDKDGVRDKDDACVDVPGPVENKGCPWPDTDGDSVLDKDDACVDVAGPAENNGCPWPDRDNDGIVDNEDKCPDVPGTAEYMGCPKPKSVVESEASEALKNILFDFGKSTISDPSSQARLDLAAKIIKEAGGTYLITGHTDKRGNAALNLRLSKERAAAVVKALEERGVPDNQLKSVGVGSQAATVPATASDAERQKDRKVVVRYVEGGEWESLSKSDLVASVKKTAKKGKKVTAKKGGTKKRK